MRRTSMLSLAALAILGLTPSTDDATEPTPEPRFVNIVGACASPNPRVAPPQITVNGVDDVQWREPSGRAESFIIEPKEPGAWPFGDPAHGAGRGEAARSGRPAVRTVGGQRVATGQIYAYKITIVCPGGDIQVIDPDIVIGEL